MKIPKSKLFADPCAQIKQRDGIRALEYNLKGKKRDKAVRLKAPYSKIATQYLYHEYDFHGKIFSWQHVTDACILADIYVTDVVSHNL